jgi:hypothetical protein
VTFLQTTKKETKMVIPNEVKKELVTFLMELPVDKFTKEWKAVQVAISILHSPKSFKKGVHVYLTSISKAHEEGCYDDKEMVIKIYPYKLIMRRTHSEYNSASGIGRRKVYRYIVPSDKYNTHDFYEVMSDLSDLFVECGYLDSSDASGICYINEHFTIETNMI